MRPTKVTQKDRYGNSTTIEYAQDVKPVDPTKLMEKQMDMAMAPPPQMMESIPSGFNGADPMTHPGEPKGPDTVPAWLTPGEFVVNAEAMRIPGAKEQVEQLNNAGRAMQAQQGGSIPSYKVKGGCVYKAEGGEIFVPEAQRQAAAQTELLAGLPGGPQTAKDYYARLMAQQAAVDYANQQIAPLYQAGGGLVDWLAGKVVGDTQYGVPSIEPEVAPTVHPMGAAVPMAVGNAPTRVEELSAQDPEVFLQGLDERMAAREAQAELPWWNPNKYFEDGGEVPPPAYLEGGGFWSAPQWLQDIRQGPAEPTPGPTIPEGSGQQVIYDELARADDAPLANEVPEGPGVVDQTLGTAGAIADMAPVPGRGLATLAGVPGVEDLTFGDVGRKVGDVAGAGIDAARQSDVAESIEGATGLNVHDDPEVNKTAAEVLDDPEAKAALLDKGKKADETYQTTKEVYDSIDAQIAEAVGTDPSVGNDPSSKTGGEVVSSSEVEKAGAQAVKESPEKVAEAESMLGGLFGDLFDKKELARMAILAAGSVALGYSPLGSARWAAGQYLERLDAKAAANPQADHEARVNKLVEGGKYSPQSIAAYRKSGNISDLQLKDQMGKGTIKPTGNAKTFYGQGGQRIQAQEVKTDTGTYWVGANGQPLNLNAVHEDASRVRGTREYGERIKADSKQYTGMINDLRDQFGTSGTGEDKFYATELAPSVTGNKIAKWAGDNDIPPEYMGQIVEGAYHQAIADSQSSGRKVRDITPYLEAQYVTSQVGDPDLFRTKDGEMANARHVTQALDNVRAAVGTNVPNTQIMQAARAEWNDLDERTQKIYTNSATSGQSGFMVFLNKKAADAIGG